MNERNFKQKSIKNESLNINMDEKYVKRRRVLGAVAAGLLTTGAISGYNMLKSNNEPSQTEITQETIDKFSQHQVDLSSIQIENGAKLRENPGVDNDAEFGNKLGEVDIDELPDTYKITVTPDIDAPTFVKVNVNDPEGPSHEWIGVPAETIAEAIPGNADDVAKDEDGVVWISSSRADYEKSE